nr:plasmid replication protein RepC [Pseudoroseicyclus aestuarii]
MAEPCAPQPLDKWAVIDALGFAAPALGLTHREVGVLRALVSFLPQRHVAPGAPLIVFPSNAVLSQRLNGMPESTLRRHLARLCSTGLLARRDSPNRKRYVRRRMDAAPCPYGFDLAPLLARAAEIAALAEEARAEAEALVALREEVFLKRRHLEDLALEREGAGKMLPDSLPALLSHSRALLRRRPRADALEAVMQDLAEMTALLAPGETRELSASDARNERHQQKHYEDPTDKTRPQTVEAQAAKKAEKPALTVQGVTAACPELRSYFPDPIRHWPDLVALADRLAPMIGLGADVVEEARRVMGPQQAAAVVLCILQSLSSIANPGGYLRRLVHRAGEGAFDAAQMVARLLRKPMLSADNSGPPRGMIVS